jgi:hypothetical protein
MPDRCQRLAFCIADIGGADRRPDQPARAVTREAICALTIDVFRSARTNNRAMNIQKFCHLVNATFSSAGADARAMHASWATLSTLGLPYIGIAALECDLRPVMSKPLILLSWLAHPSRTDLA